MAAVGVIRRHPRGGYTWIWHENWDLTPPPAATECMIEYETYEAARQGAIDAGLAVTIPHFELWDERQEPPKTRTPADLLDKQIDKPEPVSARRAALQEAAGLIEGERDAEYGTPQENFTRAASIWRVLFPERDWTPADVARAMLGIKLARTPHGYKRDSLVDAIGYAAIAVELEETA